MRFTIKLEKALTKDEHFLDLSRNKEFADFDVIGFRETKLFIEFAAFVNADDLTEIQITAHRDKFFELTRTLPQGFNLKPRGRNPNGLLCFIFEKGCPKNLVNFIQKQSKIAHWMESGVIVSWVVDVKDKIIHTHNNPVSLLPPVIILADTVYPSIKFLQSALNESD